MAKYGHAEIPLLWRGGENSERIFDGVVSSPDSNGYPAAGNGKRIGARSMSG